MNILSIFSKKSNALIFSLICGLAYFAIAASFIISNTSGGGLLVLFFFPAIICGGALFVFKAIQNYIKSESKKSLTMLFIGHLAVILLALALALEMILF